MLSTARKRVREIASNGKFLITCLGSQLPNVNHNIDILRAIVRLLTIVIFFKVPYLAKRSTHVYKTIKILAKFHATVPQEKRDRDKKIQNRPVPCPSLNVTLALNPHTPDRFTP